MSKNWDKPLPLEEIKNSDDLNIHHDLDLEGYQWRELIGLNKEKVGIKKDMFYSSYLTYCKIMNSPLGKALK